jgi:hypothetical protein
MEHDKKNSLLHEKYTVFWFIKVISIYSKYVNAAMINHIASSRIIIILAICYHILFDYKTEPIEIKIMSGMNRVAGVGRYKKYP